MKIDLKVETLSQAYLELLALRGIDYFFANGGTDFASIIDAFARRIAEGKEYPKPITVPHETSLVSMAHGYTLITGKPQAAMVHVGVGTANGLGALMNAHRARVPILFSAGRTPITEEGNPASRSVYIHWGQESFDQASIVREYVKWDYELRVPSQLEAVVDRALSIAMTDPMGPVYLTLPREVLASPMETVSFREKPAYDIPSFHPDPEKIQEAADLIAKAEYPVIITSSVGRSPSTVQQLVDLAESNAIAVIPFNPEYMCFPTNHFCYQGFLPGPHLKESDLIIILECDIPWYPGKVSPKKGAKIIQAGIDPQYSNYPIRSFPSDLTIQGNPDAIISALTDTLLNHPRKDDQKISRRQDDFRKRHGNIMKQWESQIKNGSGKKPLDMFWVSHNLKERISESTVIVNEYDNAIKENSGQRPGTLFCTPHAGFLGWGVGAALGAKLALPDELVVATVGDGSYIFSVPSACHFVSAAYNLPILIIVYNNQSYHAVKRATLGLHPDGWAAKTNQFPLSSLTPSPDYEKICEAFGGYGEKVEEPDEVGPAIERAIDVVKNEKRQALINMVCKSG